MRVLHVTAVYPSPENPERGSLVRAQIDSLRAAGVDLEVCVLRGPGWRKYLGVSQVREALRGGRFDLVHAHYAYTAWTARFATNLPLVVSYMGNDIAGKIDPGFRGARVSRFLHVLGANALAAVSAFSIAKSTGLADPIRIGRKAVIPNGVDFSRFRPMAVDRASLGLEEGTRYVLFAGRASDERKRHALALQAVELARASVPALRPMSIEKRSHDDVAKFLNAADCLLLASRFEGSPNIVKEALACNTPIVATDVGDVRERTRGVINCRVVPDDPREMAGALVEVLRDGRRAENGRESVRPLDSAAVAERIIGVYRTVLSRGRG
ncbi:MAG: glycosyltransferase [Candidatus Eiseniibacteriota bacterium]